MGDGCNVLAIAHMSLLVGWAKNKMKPCNLVPLLFTISELRNILYTTDVTSIKECHRKCTGCHWWIWKRNRDGMYHIVAL